MELKMSLTIVHGENIANAAIYIMLIVIKQTIENNILHKSGFLSCRGWRFASRTSPKTRNRKSTRHQTPKPPPVRSIKIPVPILPR